MLRLSPKSQRNVKTCSDTPSGGRKRAARRRRRLEIERLEARDNPSASLVATSFFDSAVYEFNPTTGGLQATLVAPNSSPLLSGPAGLAVGPDGNLYISSQFNNAILQYNLTGNTLSTFISSTDLQPIATANGDSQFAPAGLQFGPDGNLYVCLFGGQSSTSGGAVIRFNITSGNGGALSYKSGNDTTVATGLIQPSGLAFGIAAGDTNNLYIANSAADDVVKVANATSASPTSSTLIAPGSGGLSSSELNYPSALTWGPDGLLYVVDLGATSFQGNVLQFSPTGTFKKVVTPTGQGQPGNLQFQFPSGILFDDQGHFLTANLGSSQSSPLQGSIYEYNTDGTFDQTLVSSSQFPDMGSGAGISPSQVAIVPVATKLVVSGLTSTNVTAGSTVNFTVTAENNSGQVIPNYVDTVQLTSTDVKAQWNGGALPASYTFGAADAGSHSFTATLETTGSQTIMVTDQANANLTATTSAVTVSTGPFASYNVNVQGGSTFSAGTPFLVTVQAADAYGNPVFNYSGPSSVTASVSPTSTASNFPVTVPINSTGLGYFLANLQKTGTYTITAASGAFTGSSAAITVAPGAAAKLAFGMQPVNAPTGVALPAVTVQVLDAYGNLVSGDNTDMVTLGINTGPGSFTSSSTITATAHNGVATFNNLILVKPGVYTLSELDPGFYTGPASSAFTVTPLQVVPGSFVGTPSGFSLQFNAPILVNSVTPVLYGQGFAATAPPPSVKVTGPSGNVAGSLVVNAATNGITFVQTDTNSFVNSQSGSGPVSPLLPDGVYTVDLSSGAGTNGFQALNSGGGFLDGLGNGTPGSGDFTATFTVSAAASGDDVVWAPATADGPLQALAAPGGNQAGAGYPIYLDTAHFSPQASDVQATLNYNPTMLTVTPSSTSTFTVTVPAPGMAQLHYHGVGLNGSQVAIGFLTATVANSSAANPIYHGKDLLHLSGVAVNGGAVQAVGADALHLVAYVGDADGNGAYSSNDAVLITRVLVATDSGFAAYPLVDPVIVADTDGSGFIPSDAALQANEAGVAFPTANLTSPPIPPGANVTPTPNGVDPSLTLPHSLQVSANGILSLPVNIDDAHPAGSTGLTEAHLALTYDPRRFTVSAADIHLGSVPAAGSGWSLQAIVDQTTGQIAITLSSSSPIAQPLGGSLVSIDFHSTGRTSNSSFIDLVASANVNGQDFATLLADAQGSFTLTPALTNDHAALDQCFAQMSD